MKIIFGFIALAALILIGYRHFANPSNKLSGSKIRTDNIREHTPASVNLQKLEANGSLLRRYATRNGYDSTICFMIDMSIPSGMKRFYVYNLQKNSIEKQGLVTHGQGSGLSAEIEYSNAPGSYCTSPGKYKVGSSYNGRFGLAFKLYGLEQSNSKAFERFVVLHAHECVPASEVYPQRICESQGCPTVSPAFLKVLQGYISKSKEPILLEIYK